MRAAQINKYGGTEVIKVTAEAPKPAASEGQVLVEVYAASLNPLDSKIRQGYMQQMLPLTFPVTLGGDFAGVVIEVVDAFTYRETSNPRGKVVIEIS